MLSQPSLDKVLDTMASAFDEAELVSQPFPHFVLPGLLDSETAEAILQWLDKDAPWTIESRRFYVQHGCNKVAESIAQSPAAVIAEPEIFQLIRKHLERIFGIPLSSNRFHIAAHRLLPGHRIGVHNDNPTHGTETHRFLINFNSDFDDDHGGHLVLFNLQNLSESAVVLRPLHNCAVAMEFSDRSWHWVDEIKTGKRYSLIYSFWAEGAASTPEAREAKINEDSEVAESEFHELVELLRDIGANSVPHSNRYLIDHLIGTYRTLERWRCDDDVCKAGMFHSVFGTRSFPNPLVNEVDAIPIRDAIGERAQMLVRLFSRVDLPSLFGILASNRLLDGGEFVALNANDLRALVSLVWANILEQSDYVPLSGEYITQLEKLYKQTAHLLPLQSKEEIQKMMAAGALSHDNV